MVYNYSNCLKNPVYGRHYTHYKEKKRIRAFNITFSWTKFIYFEAASSFSHSKQKVIFEGQQKITGLQFKTHEKVQVLFVATEGEVYCMTLTKDKENKVIKRCDIFSLSR